MAVKAYGVNVGKYSAPTEATDSYASLSALITAAQDAVTTALAVSGIDAVPGATTAITAIGTAITAIDTANTAAAAAQSQDVSVLVDLSAVTTRNQLRDSLNAIQNHVRASNLFTGG